MKYPTIDSRVWVDGWFQSLTTHERTVWLCLLTNELTNIIGCYECPPTMLSVFTGLSLAQVNQAIDRFVADKKIAVDKNWIRILNFEKHNNFTSSVHDKTKTKLWAAVPSSLTGSTDTLPDRVGGRVQPTLPSPYSNSISKKDRGGLGEKENKTKQQVLNDLDKYQADFPKIDVAIEWDKCQDYYASKGKKIKDWRAAFRNWLRSDIPKRPRESKYQGLDLRRKK